MTVPALSVVMCTARENNAYSDHPDWDNVGVFLQDLQAQKDAPPFEAVVVDALHARRVEHVGVLASGVSFPVKHVPPLQTCWVRMRKVAIASARNAGIVAARGELVLSVDDCGRLPPNMLSTFWRGWSQHGVALAMCWPHLGDQRRPGPVTHASGVYGFSSAPREMLLEVNGVDLAFDGAQGLEDGDLSARLHAAGLKRALVALDGFDILSQTGHSPDAVDPERPIVKCCNASWQSQRVLRNVQVANRPELWTRETLERLVGPCLHLRDGMCGHHDYRNACAYLERGFATALDPEAAVVFDEFPVVDLRKLSEEFEG